MTAYLNPVQIQNFRDSICYAKNLIASLSAEHIEHKVHINRFRSILQRVIPAQTNGLEDFYQTDQARLAMSVVTMLSRCGEIIHLGNGYYTVPTIRSVTLPVSKKKILISSLVEKKQDVKGLIGYPSDDQYPSIDAFDWAYAETPQHLLELYEEQLLEDPDFRPHDLYRVKSAGLIPIKNKSLVRSDPSKMYLIKSLPYKNSKKNEWYIGRLSSSNWHISRIEGRHLRRIIIGLSLRDGGAPQFSLSVYNDRYHELIFKRSLWLPSEEKAILCLMGIPNKWKDPERFLIPTLYLNDVREVLKRINMKEVAN